MLEKDFIQEMSLAQKAIDLNHVHIESRLLVHCVAPLVGIVYTPHFSFKLLLLVLIVIVKYLSVVLSVMSVYQNGLFGHREMNGFLGSLMIADSR